MADSPKTPQTPKQEAKATAPPPKPDPKQMAQPRILRYSEDRDCQRYDRMEGDDAR